MTKTTELETVELPKIELAEEILDSDIDVTNSLALAEEIEEMLNKINEDDN